MLKNNAGQIRIFQTYITLWWNIKLWPLLEVSGVLIQRVIDHFTENPGMVFTDDPEDKKQLKMTIRIMHLRRKSKA